MLSFDESGSSAAERIEHDRQVDPLCCQTLMQVNHCCGVRRTGVIADKALNQLKEFLSLIAVAGVIKQGCS
jgi:hypothetical protein